MSKYYIARDKNDALYIYDKKPFKTDVSWDIPRNTNFSEFTNWDIFTEVKWEDKEPKVLTIEESPWIKVDDRLPINGECIFMAYKNHHTDEIYYRSVTFNGLDNLLDACEAIAWMPIPEFKE